MLAPWTLLSGYLWKQMQKLISLTIICSSSTFDANFFSVISLPATVDCRTFQHTHDSTVVLSCQCTYFVVITVLEFPWEHTVISIGFEKQWEIVSEMVPWVYSATPWTMHTCKYNTKPLNHWGRVTHICVGNLTITGSDNGLSPGRRQAITWTNVGILLIGPLGTNFIEILIGIQTFSFKKSHLKTSSANWRLFCLGLNELNLITYSIALSQKHKQGDSRHLQTDYGKNIKVNDAYKIRPDKSSVWVLDKKSKKTNMLWTDYADDLSIQATWSHDDIMTWKSFPLYQAALRGIHRIPVDSTNKGPVMQSFDVCYPKHTNCSTNDPFAKRHHHHSHMIYIQHRDRPNRY